MVLVDSGGMWGGGSIGVASVVGVVESVLLGHCDCAWSFGR